MKRTEVGDDECLIAKWEDHGGGLKNGGYEKGYEI
jgi:hypothetical protein